MHRNQESLAGPRPPPSAFGKPGGMIKMREGAFLSVARELKP